MEDDEVRLFEPGMVVTVEPGIYIAEDMEEVDEKYRGIGIRIEDNVLVTENGHEVLTEKAPKTIDDTRMRLPKRVPITQNILPIIPIFMLSIIICRLFCRCLVSSRVSAQKAFTIRMLDMISCRKPSSLPHRSEIRFLSFL